MDNNEDSESDSDLFLIQLQSFWFCFVRGLSSYIFGVGVPLFYYMN